MSLLLLSRRLRDARPRWPLDRRGERGDGGEEEKAKGKDDWRERRLPPVVRRLRLPEKKIEKRDWEVRQILEKRERELMKILGLTSFLDGNRKVRRFDLIRWIICDERS
ncbi:hypothetical protein KY284_036302 [Solanum tuberosum]|nr:hypothetical protein KY284_036302 [Solanum tuberosum]